ncbi:txe/YoeB family addiction module toxin [Clostridia bacterium]|nr:txe/YoeB family addiction module toxin [Clostridia bacterium]
MIKVTFFESAFDEYMSWQEEDKRTLKRINRLIKDIQRNGYDGIGKPEPLKGDLQGWWSRRIDDSNRLVYRLSDDGIEILQCSTHYHDE